MEPREKERRKNLSEHRRFIFTTILTKKRGEENPGSTCSLGEAAHSNGVFGSHTALRRTEEYCSQLRATEMKPLPQVRVSGATFLLSRNSWPCFEREKCSSSW